MNGELLRLVDSIHRDKGIDTEAIFKGIEDALVLTAQKHLNTEEKIVVTIDRATGKITAQDATGKGISAAVLGRIAAQSAKGFLLQNIKDAEGDVVYGNFESKIRTIISGTVLRIDRGDIFVLVNKIEALLPKEEQVPGESYHIGEHIKALILKVKKDGGHVRIILSRSHPDFVARLFETEVPEIADKTIQIKDVVREAGFRTKLAVYSGNPKVDPVGACVGVRGNRTKNVVEELASEKIDIIKWDEKPEVFIPNSMKPAEVQA
ncbi:MAG: transcription termination/antitermination protein NusA, partial [Planctomycetes bacterium]|nr:transcription termination/antitermination protein NusA [Planctomycetota bacterium]